MAVKYSIGKFLKRIKRPIILEDDKEYKLVTIKMNHKGVVLRETKRGFDIKSKMSEVLEGDFILSGIDARNGAFGIVPKELHGAIVTNDFWYFEIDESIIKKRLFLELTATTWFDEICQKGSDGTTQRVRLQKDKFFTQVIELPEIHQQGKLLDKILNYKSCQERLINEIIAQKQLSTQLKQAILQEAIQGKLTEEWRQQNPELLTGKKSAKNLLKRIKKEKELLIKEKKIKKEKPLLAITKVEMPFELPKAWAWCRLNTLVSLLGDGLHGTPFYSENGNFYFINGNNLVNGKIEIKKNTKRVIKEEYLKYRKKLTKNTVLVSINGTLGNVAFYNGEKVILGKSACYFNLFEIVKKKYIKLIIESNYFMDYAISKSSKTTINNLSLKNMRLLSIPFPPLEEQQEIVKKVDSLMQQCQVLEQEIKTSEANAKMLMQTVLKEAFSSQIIKEETNDTELQLALIQNQIKSRFGINYGEVAAQKTVFHINHFTNQEIQYQFINSNYGTYSPELKKDLTSNKFLTKTKQGKGSVFQVRKTKEKEILDKTSEPENKALIVAINEVLDIYELPFINKETDKIELLNTVSKLILDLKTTDIEKIYTAMQDWTIKQTKFATKADKFSKANVSKMIKLICNLGLDKKLISL